MNVVGKVLAIFVAFVSGCIFWSIIEKQSRHSSLILHAEETVDGMFGKGTFSSGIKGAKCLKENYGAFSFDTKVGTSGVSNLIVSVDARVHPVRVVIWPYSAWHVE